MLLKFKQFIKNKPQTSLNELAQHFQMESLAVKDIMTNWVQIGHCHLSTQDKLCGAHCKTGCSNKKQIYYTWAELA